MNLFKVLFFNVKYVQGKSLLEIRLCCEKELLSLKLTEKKNSMGEENSLAKSEFFFIVKEKKTKSWEYFLHFFFFF